MNRPRTPHALFYPFHLCHPETLARLLTRFATVHFRDFMALQLYSLSGMTAFQDRMGMSFPDLIESGRLVQGYDVVDRFHLLWQPPSIATCAILYGARVFTRRFAGTAASNADYSSRPTVFASETVSCQAPPHSYASWTIRIDSAPMTSIM